MYAHERSLVKKLANQPFALLGVNSDADLESIREIVKEKEITWRSFWNNPTSWKRKTLLFPTVVLR